MRELSTVDIGRNNGVGWKIIAIQTKRQINQYIKAPYSFEDRAKRYVAK